MSSKKKGQCNKMRIAKKGWICPLNDGRSNIRRGGKKVGNKGGIIKAIPRFAWDHR